MTEDRHIALKEAILRELVHTPRSYMLPERDLRSGVNLTVEGAPSQAEWEDIILVLEQDGIIARERSEARRTSLWYITPLGRRHAKEMDIH